MATTSHRSGMEQIDLTSAFDREIAVPAVKDGRELAAVLSESGAFGSSADINETINLIRGWRNDSTSDLQVGVGVKRILSLLEDAKLSSEPVQSFAEQISGQIARANIGM
jgi:vesicle-fusing ATPase